ncbi:hypothetical protein ACH4MW_15105 [Streptomyces luteogriseus]|uniref:effector-associated constant component EACC1 n=1 Tax=Streptomyces luteogriseus TaxID=68233 RepID=UPI0037A209BC
MPENVLSVRIAGGDSDDEVLRSFARWLEEEPEIRRHAVTTWSAAPPGAGEMGGTLEVVKLVLDSGFQLANFALAYTAWRSTRPDAPAVTVSRGDLRITLNSSDPEVVARLLRELEEARPEQ